MNEKEIRLQNYYIKIFNNNLFFSNNINEVLKEVNEEFLSDENYLLNLILKLNDIIEEHDYPKKVLNNINILIDKIIGLNDDSEIIEQLKLQQEKIRTLEPSNNIYEYEYTKKFLSVKNIENYTEELDIDLIESSILFDIITLRKLLDRNSIVDENEYYVYSIKRFLLEFDEMFLDKNINKKALEILNRNKNNESDKLITKIKNINKCNQIFDFIKFQAFYAYILVQNMLFDREYIIENSECIDDLVISVLYELIDEELITSKTLKKNAIEIMSIYRSQLKNSQEIETYNEYLGKINSIVNFNDNLLITDIVNRRDLKDYLKYFSKQGIDIRKLLETDITILDIYLADEEEYVEEIKKLDKRNIKLSIRKFLNILPSIFDDDTIYERTMQMINNDIILKNKINKKTFRR